MKSLWQAFFRIWKLFEKCFFINQNLDFLAKFNFWKIWVVLVTECKWQRHWFTQSIKGWMVLHLQSIGKYLHCLWAVFHKSYNEYNKLYNFAKIFQGWFFENLSFKLSDPDQGIHKHAIQNKKIKIYRVFEKVIKRKGKNLSLVHPGLRYAHKNYYLQAKTYL